MADHDWHASLLVPVTGMETLQFLGADGDREAMQELTQRVVAESKVDKIALGCTRCNRALDTISEAGELEECPGG